MDNSEEVVERYRNQGFCFPIRVFDTDEAASLRAEFEAIERQRHAGLKRELGSYIRSNSHYVLPMAERLARNPRILDKVELILGPNLLCWGCEFFIKEAHSDKIVSWHQDLTYWGMDGTDEEVTAWVALSPATDMSGCMRFVAGSHQQQLVAHRDTFADDNLLSRGQEIAVDVDEGDATSVILQPGEMSLHHGRLFHASGPNRSDDRRIAIAMRYITPRVKQHQSDRDYAMLVRGIDRYGHFTHVVGPSENFGSHSIELYDEIQASQAQALAKGADEPLSYAR